MTEVQVVKSGIGLLTADDAAELGDFFEAVAADTEASRFFHPHPLTRAYAAELCAGLARKRDRYFALWLDGRIAGYAMLRGWDEGYQVPSYGVCVHPELRDAGAGQALLAHAVQESRASGARKLRLTVYKNNHRAIHIYRKFGFVFQDQGNGKLVGILDLDAAPSSPARLLDHGRFESWVTSNRGKGSGSAEGAAEMPASLFPGRAERLLRIGVWCHYGTTLTPHEGIGVFVHNLMDGLLQLPEAVELVVLVRPGDQETMAPLRRQAPEKVRVIPHPGQKLKFRLRLCSWVASWVRRSDLTRYRIQQLLNRLAEFRTLARLTMKDGLVKLARKTSYAYWGAALACLFAFPMFFLLCWCGTLLWPLAGALCRFALFPFDGLDRLVRLVARSSRFMSSPSSLTLAREANCDVWILPYVGFEYPIDFPAVVFIHDLVSYHYPEYFDASFVEHIKKVVPRRAREAVLCCCLSDFIRQNDLLGVLELPSEKVRMVPPAAPRDFPGISDADARHCKPAGLERPYLFFPSAFRGYKNHAGLIEALAVLRDEFGVTDFDLVFTGPNPGGLPLHLVQLARKTDLLQRVRVLGRVSRSELAALYKNAYATLMPSLYEQGSFPVHEALFSGCPVACSDIPAMREQCADMKDAMLYFDPRDPRSIARAVLAIRADRDGVRQRQKLASAALWSRTWKDVAAEWLPIFREAAQIGAVRSSNSAAW